MDYEIRKNVNRGDVFYTIHWSPIVKADKYVINASVPAMGGIAELYYMDDHKKLNLYLLARSFYGGLRSTLRVAIDPELEQDATRLKVLLAHENAIYYRYALLESHADMNDIVYFFITARAPKNTPPPHSGRYTRIFVKELDTGGLVTL